MSNPFSLSGKIALVTGAAQGIGAAIAQELAQRGYTVIGTATSDEGAQRISAALIDQGGRGVKLDVNDAASVEALFDSIVKTDGGLHVLVNNAGITKDQLAMRMKDDEWDAVLDTNLKAVFRSSGLAASSASPAWLAAWATPVRPTTPPPKPGWLA